MSRDGGHVGVPHGRKSFFRKLRVDLEQLESDSVQITSKGFFPLSLVIFFEAPASTRTWKYIIKQYDTISDPPLLSLAYRRSLHNEVEFLHWHRLHCDRRFLQVTTVRSKVEIKTKVNGNAPLQPQDSI